jgi:hypothetical protein
VAGEPTLKIATHLIPRYCLAGGDNFSEPPLGRILELPPALYLISLLGYRCQYETVRGGSRALCSLFLTQPLMDLARFARRRLDLIAWVCVQRLGV